MMIGTADFKLTTTWVKNKPAPSPTSTGFTFERQSDREPTSDNFRQDFYFSFSIYKLGTAILPVGLRTK